MTLEHAQLKVIHIAAGSLRGGAARGAYNLHKGLLSLCQSSLLISNAHDKQNSIQVNRVSIRPIDRSLAYIRWLSFTLLKRVTGIESRPLNHLGISGQSLSVLLDSQEPDIIHLHWINRLVTLRSLRRHTTPMVWTLRDMWPLTGICHTAYSGECIKYQQGCLDCPLAVNWLSKKIVAWRFMNKTSFLRRVTLVAQSLDMYEKAKVLGFLPGKNLAYIPNCIDEEYFIKGEPTSARKFLGVGMQENVIFVCGHELKSYAKGFDLLCTTLDRLLVECTLLLAGNLSTTDLPTRENIKTVNLGYLEDIPSMKLAYTSADLYLSFSRFESFGKTVAESLACGTPAVTFNTSGYKSLITHGQNGFLVDCYDTLAFASTISRFLLLSQKEKSQYSQQACISSTPYHPHAVAESYLNLYRAKLSRQNDPA